MSRPASERTPLLHSASQNHPNTSAITENDVTAAEVAQQGEGAAPQVPQSGKSRGYSDDASDVLGDGDLATSPEEDLVKFQENGKLHGIGIWRFRCVFGGILLGYFVRPRDSPLQAPQ